MRVFARYKPYLWSIVISLAAAGAACQNPPVETGSAANVNANSANTNAAAATTGNSNAASTSSSSAADPGAAIEAREPERYVATLLVSGQTTGGQQAMAIPQLNLEVSRNGADRRLAFTLPSKEQIIFLDKPAGRFVISPTRKQYAELTPEATGFELPRIMTPGQIVTQLRTLRGYNLAGEEQIDGRTALKYTYAGTSRTNTQAGEVKAEAYVYVDKETGLPLRSELNSEAEGNVQGVKGLRVVTEMRDIKTEVDPASFEIPAGYSKVDSEQVRQQLNAVMAVAQAVLQNVLKQSAQPAPTAAP